MFGQFVTVIPMKSSPQDLGDMRNISCTLLARKVFESSKSEVKLRRNQYGGQGPEYGQFVGPIVARNSSKSRRLKGGHNTIITSVEYSKPFNRMSYQRCLEALKKRGASPGTVHLIATFLTNRTMTDKVNEVQLTPREVWGGCPQSSILGFFFFSMPLSTTLRRSVKT